MDGVLSNSDGLRIERVMNPTAADIEKIQQGLASYNRTHIPDKRYEAVAFALRDDSDVLCGGLRGSISYGWLFIDVLWVDPQVRSQGYGRRMMLSAEDHGRERGCLHAWLDTFSFQARPFYEKLGYTVFGELADFPPGHSRYFLSKAL